MIKKANMQHIHRAGIAIIMLVVTVINPAHSANQHAHSHGHTHGQGFMTIIFDQGQLAIEIRSPAADILGFEHAPHTPEQHALLNNAYTLLQTPHTLITLNPTCTLLNSHIDMPYQAEPDQAHSHDLAHKHENVSTSHQEKPKEHQHLHKQTHTDITANYTWQCKNAAPPIITLNYFTQYPAFNHITAQWVVNNKQGSATLTPNNPTLRF